MSNIGPGGTGPQSNIGGQSAKTNAPPNPNPGSAMPSGAGDPNTALLTSLVGTFHGIEATLQELNNTMNMLGGNTDQYRQALGLGGGHAAIPRIKAIFDAPGQAPYEGPSYRGREGFSSQLPARPGAGSTMLNMRQRAAKAISEKQWGPRLEEVPVDPLKPELGTQVVSRQNDGTYRVVHDAKQIESLAKSERVWSAAQGAFGRMAAGEGIGGLGQLATALLPEGAMGPAGIAVGVGVAGAEVFQKTAQMVSAQRQKNAEFQSVLGGGQMTAMGNRLSQMRFGLRNAFGMGQGQAEQAFMGATQLGMRGTERNNALNMAVSSFNTMGMSVAQSLAAMNVQAQSGYENFNSLEKSLKAVSDAAKLTSQNANQVRDSFISIYGTMSTQLGGGAGVQGAATGVATMKAQLGRQFQNVDFSGLTDQTRMYMMASEQGIPYNQFLQNTLTQPGYLQGAINRNMSGFMNTMGAGQGSQAFQAVQSAVRNNPEFARNRQGRYSSTQIQALTGDVLNQLPPVPMIKAVLQQAMGIDTSQMSDQMAAEYYVGWALGQNRIPGSTAAGPQQIGGAQAQALARAGDQGNYAGSPNAQLRDLGAAAKGKGIAGGIRIDVGTIGSGGTHAALRQQYLSQVAKTRSNSTIIDQMLKDNNSWKKLYTVRTAEGERTVNFNDLITHYSDQLSSGGVKYAQGTDAQGQNLAGVSVASQYGGPSDTQAFATARNAASAKQKLQGKDRFSEIKDATEKQNIQKGGKTNITISASPQLQQLFGFAINGQSITASTATSLNPTLGNVTPESLAGSSPAQYGN